MIPSLVVHTRMAVMVYCRMKNHCGGDSLVVGGSGLPPTKDTSHKLIVCPSFWGKLSMWKHFKGGGDVKCVEERMDREVGH